MKYLFILSAFFTSFVWSQTPLNSFKLLAEDCAAIASIDGKIQKNEKMKINISCIRSENDLRCTNDSDKETKRLKIGYQWPDLFTANLIDTRESMLITVNPLKKTFSFTTSNLDKDKIATLVCTGALVENQPK